MNDAEKCVVNATDIILAGSPTDVYMTVSMRMFSTRPNRNRVAVTEDFIDDVIENASSYIGLPLYADMRKVKNGDYKSGLGHGLNRKNGSFYTEMVGSFYSFNKVSDDFGVSLVGDARIPKRNKVFCEAIEELYSSGNLNFSFEITAGDSSVENGFRIVKASEKNTLTGMAVVSVPAYPEAKALALVAEQEEDALLSMFDKATVHIAEVDIDTLRNKVWKMLDKALGDKLWEFKVDHIFLDSVVIYHLDSGKMTRIDFVIDDDNFIITDVYDVVYTRKEERNGDEQRMEEKRNENMEAETVDLAAENEALKQTIKDLEKQLAESVDSTVPIEKQENGEPTNRNIDTAELDEKIAQLNTEIESLSVYKEKCEQLEAEAREKEAEAKKQKLIEFAEVSKLNKEDVLIAEAIENLDFETLVEEATKVKAETSNTLFAGFVNLKTKPVPTEYNDLFK